MTEGGEEEEAGTVPAMVEGAAAGTVPAGMKEAACSAEGRPIAALEATFDVIRAVPNRFTPDGDRVPGREVVGR